MAVEDVLVVDKNKKNKKLIEAEKRFEQMKLDEARAKIVQREKRICVEKIKAELLDKKATVRSTRQDHVETKQFMDEYNPYAARITNESLTKARMARTKNDTRTRNSLDDTNFNNSFEKRVSFEQ